MAIALQLVGEFGFERLTMDAIAARTHASKATIYSRWPSKDLLVAEALRRQSQGAEPIVAPDTGSLRGDIQETLDNIAGALQGNHGVSLVSLVEAVRDHEQLRETVGAHLNAASKTVGQAIARRAVERGELPPNADVPACIMLAVGHLLCTTLFTGRVPDRAFRHQFVETVLLPMLSY